MNAFETLYVKDRNAWRGWLEKNFDKAREIWLVYPNKASGEARMPYNDAVEEALCFGWIDSRVKTLDAHNTIQRFSPRKPGSGYSQPNRERMRWLLENGMIHPSIMEKAKEIASEEFVFPEDIIKAIRKNKAAWHNYCRFSDSYRRIRVAYIEAARGRPEEFSRRLSSFIEKTSKNKQIGFGGIEKYY